MKEVVSEVGQSKGKTKCENEKEKTKLRERHRRSITTKIFNGLRKYGGYDLPQRADINDVLRSLAAEAGWVVEADGTTYRAPQGSRAAGVSQPLSYIPGKGSGGSTPTSSLCGGECSTTTSPCHVAPHQPSNTPSSLCLPTLSSPFASPTSSEVGGGPTPAHYFTGVSSRNLTTSDQDLLTRDELAAYFSSDALDYRVTSTGIVLGASFPGMNPGAAGHHPSILVLPHQLPFLQETRASNQNTPLGSPRGHA